MAAITKLSSVIILIAFASCNKSVTQAEDPALNKRSEKSSVSFKNGKYKIDSAVIWNDRNRKTLLADINSGKLIDKKTKTEIPDFITEFMETISSGRKFELADQDEEWKSGIADFGHQIFKKVYNINKKDTVVVVSSDGKHLPEKQLIYFGLGKNIALLTYYSAGLTQTQSGGYRQAQNIVVIKFKDKNVVDFWFGGYNSDAVTTKTEIIKYITGNRANNGGC